MHNNEWIVIFYNNEWIDVFYNDKWMNVFHNHWMSEYRAENGCYLEVPISFPCDIV